jgi:hypothetical protein
VAAVQPRIRPNGYHGVVTRTDLTTWFTRHIPDRWFTGAPHVRADRDEIVVVGELPAPGREVAGPGDPRAAALARVSRFREETRDVRSRIAAEAEHLFGRKVSWGASCDGTTVLFTTLSVPVMTRLRMPERAVLDLLLESGVARSRSEALAWCVRLVAANEADWIDELRTALDRVAELRETGPDSR